MKKLEKLFSEGKLPPFYLLNFIGWTVLIILDSIILTFLMETDKSIMAYFANALQWYTGFFITYMLRFLYKRVYEKKVSLFKVLLIIAVSSFVGGFLLYLAAHIVYSFFFIEQLQKIIIASLSIKRIAFRMTQLFPIMSAWSMLYFGIKLWFDIVVERDKRQKSEFLAQEAQLQMLRLQINPHFLFNSFSSLRALIRSNPIKAVDMVSMLSEFYRYSLMSKNISLIPLKEEIDAIKSFTEIEKIRFDDKINFSFHFDEQIGEIRVPTFIIHPLVENAIKYGMKTSVFPVNIGFSIRKQNEKLYISVNNSGSWIEPQDNINCGTGTGLDNVRKRLLLTYPEKHKISIAGSDNLVTVEIIIDLT